jgi:hypothetical protein
MELVALARQGILQQTRQTTTSACADICCCFLHAQVIDDTWEPVEVPVPPHMRSVPLTFEQVEAQLPPTEVWDSDASDDGDDDDGFEHDYTQQDGCYLQWLETFGPALTRLTANQAINTLKVKMVPIPCTWKACQLLS